MFLNTFLVFNLYVSYNDLKRISFCAAVLTEVVWILFEYKQSVFYFTHSVNKDPETLPNKGRASVYLIILSAIIKVLRLIFRLHFSINNSAVFTTIDVRA